MKNKTQNSKKITVKPVCQEFEFTKVVNDRLLKTSELLISKGDEYVRNNDRFHNFNVAAKINDVTPERALHGFMTKHLVSYLDILKDIDDGKVISEKAVDEKIGDMIVYLHLQEALIKKRIHDRRKPF